MGENVTTTLYFSFAMCRGFDVALLGETLNLLFAG